MPFERFQFKRDWTETSADSDRYFKTYEDSEQQVRADLLERDILAVLGGHHHRHIACFRI